MSLKEGGQCGYLCKLLLSAGVSANEWETEYENGGVGVSSGDKGEKEPQKGIMKMSHASAK